MTIYRGERTIDGIVVTRDDQPLPEATDIGSYSDIGLDWGFVGPSSRQLSFALLFDHLRDPSRSKNLTEPFTTLVASGLDNDWELSTNELDLIVAKLEHK